MRLRTSATLAKTTARGSYEFGQHRADGHHRAALSSFGRLADQSHCCNRGRNGLSSTFRALDAGRALGTPFFAKSRRECEVECLSSNRCTHYSFAEDGDCAMCEGCALVDSTRHSSWRRLGELPVFPGNNGRANLTHGRWGSCHYDEEARASGASSRCQYKTEVEGTLSVAGSAWEYYHFLIDLVPRLLFAMARDHCDSAVLAAPGWFPGHLRGTFSLVQRLKGQPQLPPKMARRPGTNASMVPHAAILFPLDGLRIDLKTSRRDLCEARGKLISFQPLVFDWSRQPSAWFDALRRRALAAAGIPLMLVHTAGEAAEAGVLLIRRHGHNRIRRHLAPSFFGNATAFLRGRGVRSSIAVLEALPLLEQVRLFASHAARLVIGVHGAGLSNLIFSPRGHAVLEMYTAAFPCYRNLALRRGLHHAEFRFGFHYTGELDFPTGAQRALLTLMRSQGGWP